MYQALYRKYRPSKFSEVVGQDVIIKTLGNSMLNNKVSHAYLFSGPRGTGKTSIAKIFAKMLNCENLQDLTPCNNCVSCTQINNNQNIDVIEIDAASNNSVDEIREIRNKISLVPTNSKYKIYIIDEVHMLTNQAFNALLKTLEEPPSHAIFIFATTEFYKIPKTILSRCQRFDFKKVSIDNIVKRLKEIVDAEKISIDDDALREIAYISDGGMRDSISLLDQAVSYSSDKININDIHEINGTITDNEIEKFLKDIFDGNLVNVLNLIKEYNNNGKDLTKILQIIIEKLEELLIYKNTNNYVSETDFLRECRKSVDNDDLYKLIKNFSICVSEMKKSNNVKTIFEIEIIKNIGLFSNKEVVNSTNKKEDNIQIVEKTIAKTESKEENKIDETVKDDKSSDKSFIDQIKKIRINNSLVSVSNKKKNEFVESLEKLKPLLLNKNYSKYLSLLFDGTIKALSLNNFIVVYSNSLMADQFNENIYSIDDILLKELKSEYKSIAISESEWEEIKKEYNKKNIKYEYIEEPTIELNKNEKKQKNDIEEVFNDIIEYN